MRVKSFSSRYVLYYSTFLLHISPHHWLLTACKIYVSDNTTENEALFRRIEDNGFKAMVLTVDSAGDRTRHRALRYVPDTTVVRDVAYRRMTWDFYQELQNLTSLPIIPKGIQTVEDARRAVDAGAPAIFLSNHGGRALDGSPSALEVAIEIHEEDPSIFREIEVYADGGVRYGTDVLKLLALGVRAVGVGRPMMFANVYGMEGVSRAIHLLKAEIASAAAGLGVADLAAIDSRSVSDIILFPHYENTQ